MRDIVTARMVLYASIPEESLPWLVSSRQGHERSTAARIGKVQGTDAWIRLLCSICPTIGYSEICWNQIIMTNNQWLVHLLRLRLAYATI